MIITGYMLAAIMGITLGLIGAGGSILTVPIMVYILGVEPVVATGYSLLVVGTTALVGAVMYKRKNLVNLRAAMTFAIPSMFTVLATRSLIVPFIPDPVMGLDKNIFFMLLFGALMMLAAGFMLHPINSDKSGGDEGHHIVHLVTGSAAVGFITGMVGAGGGFVIIPTLILLFGLHMKEAIGTSLAIIAINSLVGFNGDIAADIKFDWHMLVLFIFMTVSGMAIGSRLGSHFDGARLKKLFGVFTLLVGIAVFAAECLKIMEM